MPAAQLAPQRAFSVASRWRRPRPLFAGRLGLPVGDLLAIGVLGLLGEFELALADVFERILRGGALRPWRDGRPARSSSARRFLSVSDWRANA